MQRRELKRGEAPLEKIIPLPLLGEGDKGDRVAGLQAVAERS
jgi:hypothetical protein